MSPRKSKPTTVFLGAMSLLCRGRAFSLKPVRPAFTPMANAVVVTAPRGSGSMVLSYSSATTKNHRHPPRADIQSGIRIGGITAFTVPWRYPGFRPLAVAAARSSRRRRRTALGMVSDQPFQTPEQEEEEKVDFRSLGLTDDLVEAMDEFGEDIDRG